MDDERILDGSDGTMGGSTQTQRCLVLKDMMKAALLFLDGLDPSSVVDLAKDQEYRDLVHRFLSPLTGSRPLHDAIDQANRVLKTGLDDISRGLAGLFPLDDIQIVQPIPSTPSRVPIPAFDLLSSPSQPSTTTTASLKPSLSPELILALRQRREPPDPPSSTPLEQIQQDRRKMVTIHFLFGSKKWGTTLQDVIDAFNEAIWRRRGQRGQRVLEAWVTKKKDIVLACQSPLDVHDSWTEDLDLSYLWESGTVVHVRRGTTTAYVARLVDITTDKLILSMETLELRLGGSSNLVAQTKAHFKRRWGNVECGTKLGPGLYLCSGSVDVLNAFTSASPADISFVGPPVSGIRQVYGTMIIGLRLSDDLDIAY